MDESTRLKIEIHQTLRQKCLLDPIFLGAHILGYDYLKEPAKFHLDVAWLMRPRFVCHGCSIGWVGAVPCPLCGKSWRLYKTDRSVTRHSANWLVLGPRGHIKTTLKTIVGGVYESLLDEDVRILIGQATLKNASDNLKGITWHYTSNPVFRELWPEYAVEVREEEPTRYEFTVPCRKSNAKEPTFMALGQDGAATGKHFEIIDFDDVVNRENVPPAATPEQMDRTFEWVQTFPMLLDQTVSWAHCRGSGTRWHDGDTYGRLLRRTAYKNWRKSVASCYDLDGNPIWPSQFSREKLEQIRLESGEYWFAANYLNDPMPAGDHALFRKENFRPYEFSSLVLEHCRVAITVDLAISDKSSADRTAIVVSAVDPSGDLFVLQALAGRWDPYRVMDMIYELDAIWKPIWIGIESVAFQKMMLYALHNESKRRGKSLPVVPLMPDGNKARRASILAVFAGARGIHVRPDDAMQLEMIHELRRMTMQGSVGEHDDFVDALSYRMQDVRGGDARMALEIRAMTAERPWWKLPTAAEELVALDADDEPATDFGDYLVALPGYTPGPASMAEMAGTTLLAEDAE